MQCHYLVVLFIAFGTYPTFLFVYYIYLESLSDSFINHMRVFSEVICLISPYFIFNDTQLVREHFVGSV